MANDENESFCGPGGQRFYGAVSEQRQIVIPAQAGEKLLVLGDPEQGLALMRISLLTRNLRGSSALPNQIQEFAQDGTDDAQPDEENRD